MTDLLSHPLIRKYFGCDPQAGCTCYPKCEKSMALRILTAMQEPIKKGDHYLLVKYDGSCQEEIGMGVTDYFHAYCLRLPQRFQPPQEAEEKESQCSHEKSCNCEWCCGHCPAINAAQPPTPPAEEAEKCDMGHAGCKGHYHEPPIPDQAVEDVTERDIENNIKSIVENYNNMNYIAMDKSLRWLVGLARMKG